MSAYAIVPAAGRSLRMGRPKLLLPWGSGTIIDAVLSSWCASRVAGVVVVMRRDDLALRSLCLAHGVTVVMPPEDPADMKESIQVGLAHLRATCEPVPDDLWLVAPADMPDLDRRTINAVIDCVPRPPRAIVVPTWHGRRGHPVRFPWSLASQVDALSPDQGLHDLFTANSVHELPVDDPLIRQDIDTPDDLARATRAHDGPK